MPLASDLQRLKQAYASRERQSAADSRYSLFSAAYLFAMQQRQRAVLRVLKKIGFTDLSQRSILEVGCGGGGVLHEFLAYGAAPRNLTGVDLLPNRLNSARVLLPHASLAVADGQSLPYAGRSVDLVLQFTAFSSILDPHIKKHMAGEMLRVVKQHGAILWYDFWINPTNKQTKGIRPAEIRDLFPGCSYEFHKITLAPPIARKIVPVSWPVALFLESLRIFNSHYLALIRPIAN